MFISFCYDICCTIRSHSHFFFFFLSFLPFILPRILGIFFVLSFSTHLSIFLVCYYVELCTGRSLSEFLKPLQLIYKIFQINMYLKFYFITFYFMILLCFYEQKDQCFVKNLPYIIIVIVKIILIHAFECSDSCLLSLLNNFFSQIP